MNRENAGTSDVVHSYEDAALGCDIGADFRCEGGGTFLGNFR